MCWENDLKATPEGFPRIIALKDKLEKLPVAEEEVSVEELKRRLREVIRRLEEVVG